MTVEELREALKDFQGYDQVLIRAYEQDESGDFAVVVSETAFVAEGKPGTVLLVKGVKKHG